MNIAILPTQEEYFNDNIFDISIARDNILERFILLKDVLDKNGHQVHTLDKYNKKDVEILIFSRFDFHARIVLSLVKKNPNIRFIYTAIEPAIVCPLHEPSILGQLPLDLIFSWNICAVKKFNHIEKCNIGEPIISIDTIPMINFKDKKFCCIIVANKKSNSPYELYSERLAAITFFSKKEKGIDLYGVGWDRSDNSVVQKVYKGTVNSKKEICQKYKFAICYENYCGADDYITEKIFDCFAAGCVPIYYGAKKVTNHIPKECFIDFRDFKNYNELYNFLINMDEQEYNKYISATKRFLQTDKYREFTSKAYVRNIVNGINELMNRNTRRSFNNIRIQLIMHVFKNLLFYLKNFRKTRRFLFDIVSTL